MIDWTSSHNEILINPRVPNNKKAVEHLKSLIVPLKSHLYFLTSGTTGIHKWVALSKKSFLCAAESVNNHLKVNSKDRFLNVLPEFHVGGLGLRARAYLQGCYFLSSSVSWRWSAKEFINMLVSNQVTISSLVPTQVFDLVNESRKCPDCVRAIVVGGGVLSKELYLKARGLGWPLLPSYGMTETCAQVATATLRSLQDKDAFPQARILDHIQVRENKEGFLCFKGGSLLTGYLVDGELVDPKKEGWLISDDRGFLVNDRYVQVLGRERDFLKIKGESVNLSYLREKLKELSSSKHHYLLAVDDLRDGKKITLITENLSGAEKLRDVFNDQVLPFERIEKILEVETLPRTELGKISESVLFKSFLDS